MVPAFPVALPLLLLQSAPGEPDPHRQFDFWLGEWSVQNRHMAPDGTWSDGDVTRARISSVCDGAAVLEEWAGDFRGRFMNGFSLRAYDPAAAEWDLLLFWTVDGNGGFGRLRGSFRHGRGEFFSSGRNAQGQETRTRYTFSDALASSVRWDSATSTDRGVTWKNDWIMEFSRTRAAAEATQDRLFDEAWTEGAVSPYPTARRLDWMLGDWAGRRTELESGVELEARLRCKLLNKDCLVLDVLETKAPGQEDGFERLCVRGFVSGRGAWESWRLDEEDTVLRGSQGSPEEDVAVFERTDPGSGTVYRETLRRLDDGAMVIEEESRARGDAESTLLFVTELWRS